MKTSFTTAIFALMILLSTQISAQYSNASLSGAWCSVGSDSEIYMIFDGAGKVTELGGFNIPNNGVNVGTYSITSGGNMASTLNFDGGLTFTGMFNNPDSISSLSFNPGTSLVRIKDPGLLSGKWNGNFSSLPDAITEFTLDSQGKIINDVNVAYGHIFVNNGKIIGFKGKSGTDCWHEASLNGTFSNNTMSGTAQSECKDTSSPFTFSRENITTLNIIAGTLTSALGEQDKASVTEIMLTGTIDARDFKAMRDEMPNLLRIDISKTTIVEYIGLGGTYGTSSNNYPANSIPRNAFYKQGGNLTLSEISFPESLTQISRSAFYECHSLSSVEIPASVTDIGQGAFYNCSKLNNLIIDSPSSLVSIGNYAFGQCWQLIQSIEIAEGLVSIGGLAFSGSYLQVNVNPNNPKYSSLNGVLFDKNKTQIIYVPPTLTGEFEIPSTVATIESGAFFHCVEITEVIISESVKKIGDYAFEYCSGLTSLNIPANVDSIGKEAFSGCESLCAVFVNNLVPINLIASDSVFKKVNLDNCVLWVPIGSKSAYENANQWGSFKHIEEFNTNNLFGQYSNSTLNGAWFLHTVPLVAMEDSIIYLIFDGQGNIIEGSLHEMYIGTYSVSSTGMMKGQLVIEGYSFPITGQFISPNEINMGGWRLTRISNPGALTETLTGVLITNNYGQRNIILELNSEGRILSSSGLIEPVSGRVYAHAGAFVGHIKTGESSYWNEFHFYGYFSNDSLIGEVVVDASKNILRKGPAKLKRSGISSSVGFESIKTNSNYDFIYPNPASEKIQIEHIAPAMIEIYNVAGTLMKRFESSELKKTIDVSALPSGIYVVKLSNAYGLATNKFIKQ